MFLCSDVAVKAKTEPSYISVDSFQLGAVTEWYKMLD